jgi:hypothetical protein
MGNVTNNNIKSVNDIVSSVIINSLQTATTKLSQSQELNLSCDASVVNALAIAEESCWINTLPFLENGEYTTDDVIKICKPMSCIGNENIEISGSIFARTITEMNQQTQIDITNQITNNIKSYVTAENNSIVPSILDITENIVKNINKQVVNVLQTTVQKSINDIKTDQLIKLKNVTIRNVSQKSTQEVISQKLLENSQYVSAVSTLANYITASTSSVRTSAIMDTFWTIIKVIIALVIIGVITWLIQKYKRHKKKF